MKPIIIAGNGPSLAQIDYSRLPKDYDVFRCNQFYFEDKYFLGKKIKGVFFNPEVLVDQIFTLHFLEKRKEYKINEIYYQKGYDEDIFIEGKKPETIFPFIKNTYDFLQTLPIFNKLDKFHRFYFHQWPTTGIVMLYTAIAQGYREIYLTGIDFYRRGGIDYVFNINLESNLARKNPCFKNKNYQSSVHSQQLDIQFIQLALSVPEIKIYAISPDSALCELLPLAPIQNQNQFKIEDKPQDYICDLIQLPFDSQSVSSFKQKLKDYGVNTQNIYVKLILDLIHLCKAIIYALKN